jgi:phospholipid transport system transporter-binding protein
VTGAAGHGFELDTRAPGTLAVRGVLSFDTAAAALRTIQAALAGGAAARLDLAGVGRSDSAGLACVLAVAAEADRRGQALEVVNVPPGMQLLAQVCEVDRLLG